MTSTLRVILLSIYILVLSYNVLTYSNAYLYSYSYSYPMPIYTHKDKCILYLHIPKTGGTSIENWFRTQTELSEHLFMRSPPLGFACTPQHLTYETIGLIFASMLPEFSYQFTIVRNPYDRLESEFFYRQKLRQLGLGKNPTKYFSAWVCDVLEQTKAKPNILDNHLRPQIEFVDKSSVEVFYFESGIPNILKALASKLNFAEPKELFHKKASVREPVIWSKKAINTVNQFYKHDFKTFNYSHKSSSRSFRQNSQDRGVAQLYKLESKTRQVWRKIRA